MKLATASCWEMERQGKGKRFFCIAAIPVAVS